MLRHVLLAAGAVALLGAAAVPVRMAPGVAFTMRSSTEGSSAEQVTKVRVLDGVIRFDMEPASDARKAKANDGVGFVLVDTKAKAMRMVMPEMQRYMEIRFDSTAGVVLQAAAMNSYVTDIAVAGDALGSGGTVNGVATRHYRMKTSFKSANGGRDDLQNLCANTMVEEFWVADALKDFPDPSEAFARAMGGVGQKTAMPKMGEGLGGAGELMRKRSATQTKLFKGMPVRTKWSTTERCPNRPDVRSAGQNDITDVRRADLDPADFRVPEGYQKFDMQSVEGLKAGFRDALRGGAKGKAEGAAERDTTSMTDAAKEGLKEAGKDAAKDAAKQKAGDAAKKLLGRFRKP